MAIISLCYLSDPLVDPTWPFILFMYSVFNLLCQIYESSKSYDGNVSIYQVLKHNFCAFFGYDTYDNERRYDTFKKNDKFISYNRYVKEIETVEKKEYNDVVQFLKKNIKIKDDGS